MEHIVPKSEKRTLAAELVKIQRAHGDILTVEDRGDTWHVVTVDGPKVEVRPGTAGAGGEAYDA